MVRVRSRKDLWSAILHVLPFSLLIIKEKCYRIGRNLSLSLILDSDSSVISNCTRADVEIHWSRRYRCEPRLQGRVFSLTNCYCNRGPSLPSLLRFIQGTTPILTAHWKIHLCRCWIRLRTTWGMKKARLLGHSNPKCNLLFFSSFNFILRDSLDLIKVFARPPFSF